MSSQGGPTELFAEVAAHNPTFYAEIAAPQSLNKYQYCLNNPLRFTDPDGHQEEMADKVKQVVVGSATDYKDYLVGQYKSAANIVVGMNNIAAAHLGGEQIQPFEPKGLMQEVSMSGTDKALIIGSLIGGKGPTNVLVAESKQTAVVSAEVGLAARGRKLDGAINLIPRQLGPSSKRVG